ncbi:MAG: bifunctional riboflavin kinase/FAD synthetase [Saccharofermentanales bacterium]
MQITTGNNKDLQDGQQPVREDGAARPVRRGIGLGVFDGCHLGHMELIGRLVDRSHELGLLPAVYTFHRHPSHVTGDKDRISGGLLTTDPDKDLLIRSRGVEETIYQEFTEEFSRCSPQEFLDTYLRKSLNAALVVVGFNFRFGRSRKGDTDFLKKWGDENGIEVVVIDPVVYKGNPISSSLIRGLVQNGEIVSANSMLGRKFSLSGEIVSGQKLGTKLGFPTANFYPDPGLCLPKNGVYATRLTVGGVAYESVTNIGLRPSVPGKSSVPIIETMMLDADFDLYGKVVRIDFIHKIRDEQLFAGLDELKAAIGNDVETARGYHQNAQDYHTLAMIGSIKMSGLKTSRFTSNILIISMRVPLNNRTASEYSLLSRVITATCRAYPTRTGFAKKMDSMYGAEIDCSTEIQGDSFVLNFSADALDNWRGLESPFDETVALLFDMLQHPDYDDNGFFREDIVESEKTGLLSEILARENDKAQYAFDRCLQLYTEGSVYSTRSFGDADVIRTTDGCALKAAFDDLMAGAEITACLGGRYNRSDADRIVRMMQSVFEGNNPGTRMIPGKFPQSFIPKTDFRGFTEKKTVEQAKICIIYKGAPSYHSLEMPVYVLMNTMLGGDADSLLFKHVREEEGLAYSVYSAQLKYLSAIFMEAGVSPDNVQKAIDAMNAQIGKIQRGEFDAEMMKSAVKSITYAYSEISDSLRGLVRYFRNCEVTGMRIPIEDAIAIVRSIRPEQIQHAASRLLPSVTYVLSSEDR